MTTFKTQIELLIDKCVKNITIALFDYETFKDKTQEQIDTFLAPDRMLKHKLLERAMKEVEENQNHFRLLTKMKETYGDNQPTDNLTGAIQEAFDRASREHADTQHAEETGPEAEVRLGTPDGGTADSGAEDTTGDGGHRAEPDTSGGAGEDDSRGGAVDTESKDDIEEGNTVPIRRVGVE